MSQTSRKGCFQSAGVIWSSKHKVTEKHQGTCRTYGAFSYVKTTLHVVRSKIQLCVTNILGNQSRLKLPRHHSQYIVFGFSIFMKS